MIIEVKKSDSDIDWNADTEEQLKNDVLNMLRTKKGEVPFMPDFGLPDDLVGQPAPEVIPELRNAISEQLESILPDAEINDIAISYGASGDMIVEVSMA